MVTVFKRIHNQHCRDCKESECGETIHATLSPRTSCCSRNGLVSESNLVRDRSAFEFAPPTYSSEFHGHHRPVYFPAIPLGLRKTLVTKVQYAILPFRNLDQLAGTATLISWALVSNADVTQERGRQPRSLTKVRAATESGILGDDLTAKSWV